jgi:16S rRNA (cytosine967-C5)-methyltransferase
MKVSPARAAAFDVLLRIERDNAFSSILLPQVEAGLSPKDRSLCHEIVLGTLRRQIYLDRILDSLLGKKKLDLEVRIALRIGIFQLHYLDKVPGFSAVNESVELVQRARKSSAKGLVNAVLRKASKGFPEPEFSNDLDRISTRTSHPQWLIEKWIKQFGFEETAQLAEANNRTPSLVFRKTLKTGDLDLDQFGEGLPIAEGAYTAARFSSELRAASETYQVYFQDAGSQMVARTVRRLPAERFLDVCAAPGSKTTYVALVDASLIVAGDVSRSRVTQLKENCANQGADFVGICQYDAQKPLPFAEDIFDVVLVDAPCSGTGTIRHNPEIRYFLGPEDFGELSFKQLKILKNASKVVRPGRRLIYSSCSLEVEENEEVVRKFVAVHPDFYVSKPAVDARFMTDENFARTFPHRDEMDGFFMAELIRREK